ncbi:SDR family oxidoreductase [Primorskyibacter sp. S187A]|uniref:SDR family oxidoreductase n=1 Tax=Primorskyibacter sp. S187A TaxID=3415130 RepID=UPI003C79EDAB
MQIEGQVAVVSGGASGLGAATARHLAALGARVAVLDFNGDAAGALAAEIGGQAETVDVRDEASVAAAMDKVAQELGVPRVVVNTAGIADAARVVNREGQTSVELFRRVIEVNLIGTYTVMSHAARHMAAAEPVGEERGVVINTASIAFEDGQMGQTAYAASKGGVAAMALPAAREMARQGIRVMTIAPGLFETPMMQGLPEEVAQGIVANIPFPARLGAPEEYARLVQSIVENSYFNGTVVRLDGAVRLPPR